MQGNELEHTLHDYVQLVVDDYFRHLGNEKPSNIYDMVISEVEKGLFKSVLAYTKNNHSKAAKYLGLNRGTLRKKLNDYGYHHREQTQL